MCLSPWNRDTLQLINGRYSQILVLSHDISFWIVPSLSSIQGTVAIQLGDPSAAAFYVSIYTMTVTIAFMFVRSEKTQKKYGAVLTEASEPRICGTNSDFSKAMVCYRRECINVRWFYGLRHDEVQSGYRDCLRISWICKLLYFLFCHHQTQRWSVLWSADLDASLSYYSGRLSRLSSNRLHQPRLHPWWRPRAHYHLCGWIRCNHVLLCYQLYSS